MRVCLCITFLLDAFLPGNATRKAVLEMLSVALPIDCPRLFSTTILFNDSRRNNEMYSLCDVLTVVELELVLVVVVVVVSGEQSSTTHGVGDAGSISSDMEFKPKPAIQICWNKKNSFNCNTLNNTLNSLTGSSTDIDSFESPIANRSFASHQY
jgi:hypothetical protein